MCRYILKAYKIDTVYSSPLSMAYDTVKGVAKELGLIVHKEDDLRELNLGKREGLSYGERFKIGIFGKILKSPLHSAII